MRPEGGLGSDADLAAAYAWSGPGLRANFVCSTDGGASLDGRSGGLGSAADKRLFAVLRTLCDVVLVGAGTARVERYRPAAVPIAVVSRSLDLDPGSRLFDGSGARPILLTVEGADPGPLADVADVVVAGTERVEPALALAALGDRGLDRVLCEGGPSLFADLVAADAVDELCLTLAPVLTGGGPPRMAMGAVADQPRRLSLLHVLHEDGALFLRYGRGG